VGELLAESRREDLENPIQHDSISISFHHRVQSRSLNFIIHGSRKLPPRIYIPCPPPDSQRGDAYLKVSSVLVACMMRSFAESSVMLLASESFTSDLPRRSLLSARCGSLTEL